MAGLTVLDQALTTRELLKPFLAGQLSRNTIRAYQYDIAQFFGLQDIRQLTLELCERLCSRMLWSAATV